MIQTQFETDPARDEFYLPGHRVPAGLYHLIGTDINVCLEEEGYLPASLDGRVACFESVRFTWQQLQQDHVTNMRQPE